MPAPNGSLSIGIDVGARAFHAVAILDGALSDTSVFAAERLDALVEWASGAAAIAIDSPDAWSTAPHRCDLSLAPKFRTARCGEVGLGRQFGAWVSWTTPTDPRPGTWMDAGIGLFAALHAAGHDPIEVYPFAAFRSLAHNRSLPKKQTRTGREARTALLASAGLAIDTSSHHFVDAAVAALVASHHLAGRAIKATCGHDGSAIWLPAPLPSGVAEASASLRRR